MSTPMIIGLIGASLFVLVAIAVAMQTIEKSNQEKKRLESSLKSRARNFQYMLEGFPDGFLNKDLKLLVAQSLDQIYQQLVQTQPKRQEYRVLAARIKEQLSQIAAQGADTQSVPTLSDPKQIKEIQQLLNSLYGYIAKLRKNSRISEEQAKAYALQIRRLMVQSSLDGLRQAITQASSQGKFRLALHYVELSIDKMKKENAGGFFNAKIAAYQQQAAELGSSQEEKDTAKEEAAKEWDELTQEDDSWKKKAIYD